VIERNIASAIDLVVQTKWTMEGARLVTEVVTLAFDEALGRCVTETLYARRSPDYPGTWKDLPEWFDELIESGVASEGEVGTWRQSHLGQ